MNILVVDVDSHSDIIFAAGGVIERHTNNGIKIAVIRRERYGREWCLPKGKVNEHETLVDALYREIHEETGCKFTLVRFLGTDAYPANNKIKSVYYWLCHLQNGECEFQPNEEVKELLWLSPEQAAIRLTHASQQKLVRNLYLQKPSASRTYIQKAAYLYSRYGQPQRWKRLNSTIMVYREELSCLLSNSSQNKTEYVSSICGLLDEAKEALMEGNVDRGWKCFHAARRLELLSINDQALLSAKAEQLRDESDKLNAWRKEAVNSLLPKKMDNADISASVLYDAALIRDEHYSNNAYKSSLKRTHHFILASLLIGVLVWINYALSNSVIYFGSDKKELSNLGVMYPGLITFGVLGAIFSATLKSINTDMSSRIPEMILALRVTLLRIVLGASAAVIIYLILISSLGDLLSDTINQSIKNIDVITIYVIALVSGITERLVLNVVDKISK